MSFQTRISHLPRVFPTDHDADFSEIAPYANGDVAKLIQATLSASPYLRMILQKETLWLEGALDDPEAALKAVFDALPKGDPKSLSDSLREAKRRVGLLSALADLGGVWSLEKVTGTLTDFADLATDLAIKTMVGKEILRGKLPGAGEDDIATAGGLTCLAMGKMGAHELNYSSDIDLICLFDETRYERSDYMAARSSLVRATRGAMALLNDLTGEGYVFRTDLRLRPDPAVTPVCLSMEAAERYYESLGRTWERAAYIKARPCAGDLDAGARFLQDLHPFVWRKHLDFAAIQDAHDMRLRIREHKGFGKNWQPEGHNIKLGRGGIREIEFFTQTRQMIAGGRDPDLQIRGTLPGLAALARKDWIPDEVARRLSDHYRAHRTLEHRIQMVNDAQTHDIPKTPEALERVACLMGVEVATLKADIIERVEEVHSLTEGFFAPEPTRAPAKPVAPETFDPKIMARWPSYAAFRTERASESFRRFKPELLAHLERAAKPDEALAALDGFLAGLPAGVQLFSLFESNPQLVDLLSDIVGTSPNLARYLSRNSSVFDAVIGGGFFADWPGCGVLAAELTQKLSQISDYENILDSARRWKKEWHFRIGVHHLRGLISADEAGAQYADLAEAVLAALWPFVVDKFLQKYGSPPGRGAMILAMGSLGAGRLNAGSDLDLIAIYDAADVDNSQGPKVLAARAYYAKLTQALVTALSAPMAEGRLYEVDMRLRPSGTQGPVATSLASFKAYQRDKAWTWEHLALTRARPIAGDTGLMQEIEAFRREILVRNSDNAQIRADVADMRQRIAEAKAPAGVLDAKIGAGRLQDIELTAQTAALLAGSADRSVAGGLEAGVVIGWLDAADCTALKHAYDVCWRLQVTSKLLSEKPLESVTLGAGGQSFLIREIGADDMGDLENVFSQRTCVAAQVIATLFYQGDRGNENG